ncbi:TonB family protein [Thalassotalea ganghwensis]
MKKIIIPTVLGSAITLALFGFMASLVKSNQLAIIEIEPPTVVQIYGKPEDSKPIDKKPPLIEPPVKPKPMPLDLHEPLEPAEPTIAVTNIPLDTTTTRTLTAFDGAPDREAQAIVRIPPNYPMDAAQKGIQGWVKLQFDINKVGQVINVEVIDSQPSRIFDREAKKALKKWKYKAKVENGQAIEQKNVSIQLDFTLEQSGNMSI